MGLGVQGGSGCWTDMVLRRWVRLHRKSGLAERPNEPFLKTMRTEGDFLGLALCPNWSVERWAAYPSLRNYTHTEIVSRSNTQRGKKIKSK